MPDGNAALKLKSQIISGGTTFFSNFGHLLNLNAIQITRIEKNRMILFAPFFFGCGAAIAISFFSMSSIESAVYFACSLAFVLGFLVYFSGKSNSILLHFFVLFTFMLLIGDCGFINAKIRIKNVKEPILNSILYDAKISGEIISISRSTYGAQRAKIRIKSIDNIKDQSLPKFARLNLEGVKFDDIGKNIECSAFLAPPTSKVLPNSYDFRMWAYFSQIGAIGRCKSDFIITETGKESLKNNILGQLSYLRSKKAAQITNNHVGGGAGFLAAIATGDRSYLSKEDTQSLQTAGLAHIISVSGLHVGLLGGILFFVFRKILSLFPFIALKFDTKKIAAIFSFAIVVLYTFFTGAEAPALRSMIMFGAATIAILINRRAISMRGLAIAALFLLIWHPENSLDAGFLMSFLATMALVSLWEFWQKAEITRPRNWFEKTIFWLVGAILTSLVAGLATIPIALYNFQSMNTYGLLTNVISAPLNDFIIAPSAIIGVSFQNTIIGDWFLNIAIWGLQKILDIAYFFSQLPNATTYIHGFDEICAFLSVFAIIWFCFLNSKLRYFAIIPTIISIIIWLEAPKNEAYFSADASAMMNLNDNSLCFQKSGKFSARQMVNLSQANQAAKQHIIDEISQIYSKQCAIGSGDWAAHFINIDKPKSQNKFINQSNKNLISILIHGKSYIIDNEHTPNGAILKRKNDNLFIDSNFKITPWNSNIKTHNNAEAIEQ